jgi:hypothetical protein
LTAGDSLCAVLTDPSWRIIAKRISPFFYYLLSPRRRELSVVAPMDAKVYGSDVRIDIVSCTAVNVLLKQLVLYPLPFFPRTVQALLTSFNLKLCDGVTLESQVFVYAGVEHYRLHSSLRTPTFVKIRVNGSSCCELAYMMCVFRVTDMIGSVPINHAVPTVGHDRSFKDYGVFQIMTKCEHERIEVGSYNSLNQVDFTTNQYYILPLSVIMCCAHVVRKGSQDPYYVYNRMGDYFVIPTTFHRNDFRCEWETEMF